MDKFFDKTIGCVDELKLKCDRDCGFAKIISWVCAALQLKLHQLDLKVPLNDSKAMFRGLHGCSTFEYFMVGMCLEGFVCRNLKNCIFVH